MFGELSKAIIGLTAGINKLSAQTDIATKDDLRREADRIIKAIKASGGGVSDTEAAKLSADLKQSEEPLAEAVKSNQP